MLILCKLEQTREKYFSNILVLGIFNCPSILILRVYRLANRIKGLIENLRGVSKLASLLTKLKLP